MKLTFTKEFEIKDADINISVDLKKETSTITLGYTCPECAGYGCRRENKCNDGTISMKLDPTQLDKNLDAETIDKFRSIIQKLSSSLTKHQVSDAAIIPLL